jgi:hypothetical protein
MSRRASTAAELDPELVPFSKAARTVADGSVDPSKVDAHEFGIAVGVMLDDCGSLSGIH